MGGRSFDERLRRVVYYVKDKIISKGQFVMGF